VEEKKRILLVDDDIDLGDLYAKYLLEAGFEVDVCRDGGEAVDKVKENHYDLILLDIMMMHMDGLTFLKVAGPWLEKTGVVMLTNLSRDGMAEKAVAEGAVGFINKTDIDPGGLVIKVKGFLGQG
jgi:DNA-binding response OmpR family regulator